MINNQIKAAGGGEKVTDKMNTETKKIKSSSNSENKYRLKGASGVNISV
jgi:hypothetical protein